MGYSKMISYSNLIELFTYEQELTVRIGRSRSGPDQASIPLQGVDSNRSDSLRSEARQARREDNARRTAMVFRRLVSANLGESENPLLLSLTYAENNEDVRSANADFKAFARRTANKFGISPRYIVVPEFQKRGAIHFHALVWDLPSVELEATERRTRLVAKLWGKGFVDLKVTDGDHRIASYLAKYMTKAFLNPQLRNMRAFNTSRNIKRPVVEIRPLTLPLFWGGLGITPDLSTADLLRDTVYMTKWLGKGRFRLYQLKA